MRRYRRTNAAQSTDTSPAASPMRARARPNWNLTFEMPMAQPKGAVLLLHGLTDSPYSMRALAELFAARGWYVVGLRLPGHGTAPAALTRVTWQDWAAAARLAAKHLRARTGCRCALGDRRLFNGRRAGSRIFAGDAAGRGAAAGIRSRAPVARDRRLPRRRLRRLAGPNCAMDGLAETGVDRDPTRVRSLQVQRLYGQRGRSGLSTHPAHPRANRRPGKPGGVAGLPPVLAFQSVADATVSTAAVVDVLFAKLAAEGHALVAFDINRDPELEPLLSPAAKTATRNLLTGPPLPFDLTVLGNAGTAEQGERDLALVARHRAAGSMTVDTRPTAMSWPRDTYSLGACRTALSRRRSGIRGDPAGPLGLHVSRQSPTFRRARSSRRSRRRFRPAALQPILSVHRIASRRVSGCP